jgi:hypothetical protein
MMNIFKKNPPQEAKLPKKWDRDYVRKKYEIQKYGRWLIYYPAQNPKRLVIVFGSMSPDRYDRYSWFWQEDENWQETSYLFFKDDEMHYFLGTDAKPTKDVYFKIIREYITINKITNQNVHCVGGSMGGYSAIYYASILGLNSAITCNPQIDLESTIAHQYYNWERQIREMGRQWYDLDKFILKHKKVPNIYIEYGNYPADKLAAEKLIKAIQFYHGIIIVRKTQWQDHTVNALSKSTIESCIQYFESLDFSQEK